MAGLRVEFLQLLNVDHYLQRSSKFNSKALDQGLVGEEQQSCTIHLLFTEDSCIVLAVRGTLKELDDLSYGPGADINRKACRETQGAN